MSILHCILLSDRDIPSQKLLALQKVLESDFFNAVREVYEHVHETVDIQGDPEVRANATAKVRTAHLKYLQQYLHCKYLISKSSPTTLLSIILGIQ